MCLYSGWGGRASVCAICLYDYIVMAIRHNPAVHTFCICLGR